MLATIKLAFTMSAIESTPQKETNAHNVTILYKGEDHTLGNMLRDQLLKDPEVIFAAYKVPHPLFRTVEVRVQTMGTPCKESVNTAIEQLVGDLDSFSKTFNEALSQ